MRKSSIHIQPCKIATSELHNTRQVKPDYLVIDHCFENRMWQECSIATKLADITARYEASTGQKMQKKATPIREAVVVLEKRHWEKQELYMNLNPVLKDEFNLKIFQLYIHRDEGKDKDNINYHAHLILDWTDENGKSIKLDKKDMSRMQTRIAEVLGMERGEYNSKAIRLEHGELRQFHKDMDAITPDNLSKEAKKDLDKLNLAHENAVKAILFEEKRRKEEELSKRKFVELAAAKEVQNTPKTRKGPRL